MRSIIVIIATLSTNGSGIAIIVIIIGSYRTAFLDTCIHGQFRLLSDAAADGVFANPFIKWAQYGYSCRRRQYSVFQWITTS